MEWGEMVGEAFKFWITGEPAKTFVMRRLVLCHTGNVRYNIAIATSTSRGRIMAVRYIVELTEAERHELQEIISKNKANRNTIVHAYILLKAERACGWT